MNINHLKELGLTENEARVYVALLQKHNASAPFLAKLLEIPKSTVYELLKSLTSKGLVKTYIKQSKKQYAPADPAILQNKVEKQKQALKTVYPQLEALYTDFASQGPQIRFYSGKAGVKIVLDEMLSDRKSIDSVCVVDDIFLRLDDYFPKFGYERAKRGIRARIIVPDSEMARQRQEIGKSILLDVEIKNFPVEFHSFFTVWGNKVAMITLQEDLSIVVIESKDVAQTHRAMIEYIATH